MLIGLRAGNAGLVSGRRDGSDPDDVCEIARIGFGDVEGVVVAVPMLPEQLLADQERALACMERAVQIAAPIAAVGLGSVLSVVAGRGKPLQDRCGIPITTGNAATAWAAWRLTERVAQGRPVAVVGSRGAVGKSLVELCRAAADPSDLRPYPVVVGAHTSGGTVAPHEIAPGTTIIDVALPRTLAARPDRSVTVLAGESIALPEGWRRNGWGHVFHVVAGYGHRSVYACVLEPMIAALIGRETPWAQGRHLPADAVRAFAAEAESRGFVPEIRRA
jgi:predicted amino acid dehydrogenase